MALHVLDCLESSALDRMHCSCLTDPDLFWVSVAAMLRRYGGSLGFEVFRALRESSLDWRRALEDPAPQTRGLRDSLT